LLGEALNALGFKDKSTVQEGKVQVAINSLPWPRSEIVPLWASDEISAQKGAEQYAVVSTKAFGATALDSPELQHKMIGRGATSIKFLFFD
jgi:hypothetical protein